jgi:hypothetical protein
MDNPLKYFSELRDPRIERNRDAARLNSVIRQHWGIENKLHWVLDVGFGEDLDRKRAGHAAQNSRRGSGRKRAQRHHTPSRATNRPSGIVGATQIGSNTHPRPNS